VARPPIEIDKKVFENACELHFGCSVDTIERWCKRVYNESFAELYNKLSEGGKMSLRRNQMKLSETNATMAIWLGKQWLGQKDKDTYNSSENGEEGFVISIEDCS